MVHWLLVQTYVWCLQFISSRDPCKVKRILCDYCGCCEKCRGPNGHHDIQNEWYQVSQKRVGQMETMLGAMWPQVACELSITSVHRLSTQQHSPLHSWWVLTVHSQCQGCTCFFYAQHLMASIRASVPYSSKLMSECLLLISAAELCSTAKPNHNSRLAEVVHEKKKEKRVQKRARWNQSPRALLTIIFWNEPASLLFTEWIVPACNVRTCTTAMCLIWPSSLPLGHFRCFPFSVIVSASPDSHVSDPADDRGAIASAAAANSQTLALSACVYPRLQESTQCSRLCLQSTQAQCSDSRKTETRRGCLSGFIQHMRKYLNKVFWNVSFLYPFPLLLGGWAVEERTVVWVGGASRVCRRISKHSGMTDSVDQMTLNPFNEWLI